MQPARPLGHACCIPPQVFNALPALSLDIFLSPTHTTSAILGSAELQ